MNLDGYGDRYFYLLDKGSQLRNDARLEQRDTALCSPAAESHPVNRRYLTRVELEDCHPPLSLVPAESFLSHIDPSTFGVYRVCVQTDESTRDQSAALLKVLMLIYL